MDSFWLPVCTMVGIAIMSSPEASRLLKDVRAWLMANRPQLLALVR
jgi:hypothetical protein